MEALRKVDRYGVQSGRQYQGFKMLPSGAMTQGAIDDAVRVLSEYGPMVLPLTVEGARQAARVARSRTHPDVRDGQDREFLEVQAAVESLALFFGVPL